MATNFSIDFATGTFSSSQSTTTGPLSQLFGNDGGVFSLQYPRDLSYTNRGHVVRFSIRKVQGRAADLINAGKDFYNKTEAAVTAAAANPVEAATQATQEAVQAAKDVASDPMAAANKVGTSLKNLTTQKTDVVGSISLYMPETVNFNYTAQYDKLTVADAAGSVPLVGTVAKAITGVLQNPAVRMGINAAGYVFNPQQQLLFEGIDFRTYQMSFTFTPYSRDEAQQVKDIVNRFRQYTAPELAQGSGGMFFIPPAIFDITFMNNGAENTNIQRLRPSVIENIDVNYSPNGQWAAHQDGTPVQTVLTLSFREMDLITRDLVEQGY
jgi:hypothetical protein